MQKRPATPVQITFLATPMRGSWLPATTQDTSGYDLHGAGSVVFDTKAEEVSDGTDFEVIYHHARLVRGGDVTETPDGDPTTINPDRVVSFPESDTGGVRGGPGGQQGGLDLAAAAAKLGITQRRAESCAWRTRPGGT